MKRTLLSIRALRPVLMVLTLATAARAAEEAGSPAEQPVGMTFKWIHFVILAVALYWLFTKVLPPKFRRNQDTISAAITKATAAKARAERQLEEAAAKLASLEQEVSQFRALAQKEAATEIARLRTVMKTDIEKVGEAAKAEIAAAERAARVELKALAAKLAVDGAESLVAGRMTPAVQEAMINNFVLSLAGRPN